jgi:hypothetical protein
MIRPYILYFKTILKTNALVSIPLTILFALPSLSGSTLHSLFYLGISSYIVWLMTGGFLLSLLYFHFSRKNEYYFYYNLGISKMKLILLTYSLHLIFIAPLLYILQYV